MNKIILDFSETNTYWELHEYLKEIFGLPEYYGHNLDALWDCLYCCYDRNTTIQLRNLNRISEDLKGEVEIMLELFQELGEKNGVIIQADTKNDFVLSDYKI